MEPVHLNPYPTIDDEISDPNSEITPVAAVPLTPAGTLRGQPSPLAHSVLVPTTVHWERYEIRELLGKGGMGAVYKARDRKLGRTVALKFILGDDPQLAQRFIQEARAQARIEHDNVCKVYEVGEFQGHAFIAMQFIAGLPLDAVQRQMSLEEKVTVLTQVAEAVHAAHHQGVIHRDLKPGNIMVERGEDKKWRPVVMDFGLAHDASASQVLTQAGALLGTPQYMPPEQARGDIERIDCRSDVYGLGAVLYELLTGQPPFIGDTVTELLLQVLDNDPVPPRLRVPSLPVDLETIALKCLQKEPLRRYDSARALADDLQRYLDGEPILARPTSGIDRALRWARKRPAVVGLAGALLLGSILSGGILVRAQAESRALAAQAQLAEQLGQDVKEMELFMRVGYMMPRHDVTPEKKAIRERMRQIEQRALRFPVARRAVAEYALGRGHLALGEYGAALKLLQRSWNHGYRGTDLSYALGRALGDQYKLKLEEVERVNDAGYRQRERQKLEAEYLTPARQQLNQASTAPLESPEYVQGLLALYSQHNEDAIAKAAAALRNHPWQYEAHVLAGDAFTRMGITAQDHGHQAEGRQDFERAIKSYAQAADLARSDASVYEAEASVWANVIENVMRQGGDPREAYENGLRACDHAITVEPQSIKAYEEKIRVYERWGNYLFIHGGSIKEIAALAGKTLDQALLLGQVNALTYDAMGGLATYSFSHELSHGLDPQQSLMQGRVYFQKAISANPNLAWPWNDWGALESINYDWLNRHGGSLETLEAHLAGAVIKVQRAIEIDPSYANGYGTLIALYINQAKIALAAGQNPEEFLRASSAVSKLGIHVNDQDFILPNNYALAKSVEATYWYLSNRDPSLVLAMVYENADKAQRLKADYPEHYQTRADAHLLAASHALELEGDVDGEVTLGLQALAERANHSPNDARDETLRTQLLLVHARWLTRQGKSARADWQQATLAAEQALKLDAEDPEAHVGFARLVRYRIELGAVDRHGAEKLLEQGLVSAAQALRQQPWNTFAQAAQAALWLLRGRLLGTPGAQRPWHEKGSQALSRALQQNHLLKKEYGVLLTMNERTVQ